VIEQTPVPGEWWEVVDPSSRRIPRVRVKSVDGDRIVWGFGSNKFTSPIRMFTERYRRVPPPPPKPPRAVPRPRAAVTTPPSSSSNGGGSSSRPSVAPTTPPEPSLKAPQPPPRVKNLDAVMLGRLGGAKGGPARAVKLSAARLSAIGRTAAAARWAAPKVAP